MKAGRLILLLGLMVFGCSSAIQHINGGVGGLNSQAFWNTTHMVAMGNTIQAKTLLAQMPPNLKSRAEWHYLKARNLLSRGKVVLAIQHLRIAMQRAGNIPAIQNDLAAALIMAGKPADAIPLLQQIRVAGFKDQVANNLAAAFLGAGKTGEALNRFSVLTASNPNDPFAWYNLSIADFEAGQVNNAVSSMKKAQTFAPDNRDILTGLAMECAAEGDAGCADLTYNKAISLYPTDWKILNNYGTFLANQGRDRLAQQEFLQAVHLNPKCASCLYNLGRLNEKWGKTGHAIAYYRQFLDIAPKDSMAGKLRQHIKTLGKKQYLNK